MIKESAPDESSAEMLQLFSSMDEQTKEIMLIQMRALAKRGGTEHSSDLYRVWHCSK